MSFLDTKENGGNPPHAEYVAVGPTPSDRARAYRSMHCRKSDPQ